MYCFTSTGREGLATLEGLIFLANVGMYIIMTNESSAKVSSKYVTQTGAVLTTSRLVPIMPA